MGRYCFPSSCLPLCFICNLYPPSPPFIPIVSFTLSFYSLSLFFSFHLPSAAAAASAIAAGATDTVELGDQVLKVEERTPPGATPKGGGGGGGQTSKPTTTPAPATTSAATTASSKK